MDEALGDRLTAADPAELGRRIRRERLKLDITQGELARDFASTGYISRIEAGKRRPDLGLLTRLALRLGTTAENLLSDKPHQADMALQASLDHAELCLRGGQVEDARTRLDEIEDSAMASPAAEMTRRYRLLSATTEEALGNLDAAILALEDLVSDGPATAVGTAAAVALSRCYREAGDLGRAIDTGDRWLAVLRADGLGGSDDAVQLSVTVAAAHFVRGDTAHAVRVCRRAVDEAEQLGTPVALASAYWNASIMEFERGDPSAAVELAQRALRLLDSSDSTRNLARLRAELGIFQLRLDPPELESATANFAAAAREFKWSTATPVDRGRNDVAWARAKLLAGDPRTARQDAGRVLAELRDTAPIVAVGALIVMGQASFELNESDEAADLYRQAVHVLTGVGADRAASQAWFELGSLLDEVGLEREAHHAYRNAAASTGLVTNLLRGTRAHI